MGGKSYDCLENPLGAVRLTFEKAVSAAEATVSCGFDPSAFDKKDWGAVELFRNFIFDQDGLSRVPFLEPSTLSWLKPNTLVRFRGMVQDMFGNELYIGAFKDEHTWRTNKFRDLPSFQMSSESQTRLWERRLLYCVPVPGQNSWTFESSLLKSTRDVLNCSTSQRSEKRRRDDNTDAMEFDVLDDEETNLVSTSKKQKEDSHQDQSTSCETEFMKQDNHFKEKPVSCSEANPLPCLVKVYDTPESDIKLNDVVEFIGIYTFDPELVVHKDDSDDVTFDLMEDLLVHLPPSKVPRLHCLIHRKLSSEDFLLDQQITDLTPKLIKAVGESLLRHLTAVLGNDRLTAQCVLLNLLSNVRARVDSIAVGRLSLNLTGFTVESASIFGNQLTTTLKSILPFSQAIPLTVEYLNTVRLQPRKDNQVGRLVTGALQLAEGTHIIIDETCLNSGTLNSTGVANAILLKHLMECQMVEYDFEFYKLEMQADLPVIILSEGKSNICPADLVVPFRPTTVSSSANVNHDELQSWRWYLATLRSLPHFIEPQVQKILEDDLVSARKDDGSLKGEDFSRWLTMARLMSASFGETNLSLEHWQIVRELERLRKDRIGR